MFKKILIANRGEIAVRIIRAARELGIATVAVYSDADAQALHVQLADEAICIGEAAAAKSYLDIPKIIAAARQNGAQAIHPGYGFLSERATFAKACKDVGIAFIGPSVDAIERMGNKLASRKLAIAHQVPVTPGSKGGITDLAQLKKEAAAIGFPVLIKAAAGGGGKGMRIVHAAAELAQGLEMALSESKKAFGDDTVFIEKYVATGRHIEFQVLGDKHGNLIHLFERECSIQRRHQKIVEESPSVALDAKLRARMGEAAVRLAKAVNYDSAGTVEFLLDDKGEFYLLEMNTRIQVEHPVTEMVTGVDLLQWQIRLAAGEKLTLKQADLRQNGHAIECRVYAEDPGKNFMPAPGKLLLVKEPQGPGIRNDSGVYGGWTVTTDYDPMLSKLIVHAPDRDTARRRMLQALRNYTVLGVQTTIPYLIDVLQHKAFQRGETYTRFIGDYMKDWREEDGKVPDAALIAAALFAGMATVNHAAAGSADAPSPWQTLGHWQVGGVR